jgi:hypothetical protein
MTIPLPWGGRVALLLLLPIGLLPLFATVQRSVPQAPAHRFQDWSTRHAIYSQSGTSAALEAARSDPRALFHWREVEQREVQQRQPLAYLEFRGRRLPHRFPNRAAGTTQRDWSISLGTAGTANAMYPAKFGFNVTSTPSCANDFVVFPVNAAGSATQPNIVAFNNLYSGSAAANGSNGFCNRTPVAGKDTGIAATVLWSYNVSKIGGAVTTSPVISFDNTGSKIAFVESLAGQPAHFHVLAWKSGDGQVSNLQSVLTPAPINAFVGTAPTIGSGTATDLALGALATGSDTLSSPYVDYGSDLAYVGNDIGVLYRIKNVFCTTTACANAAPSLDASWGTGGALTIGGTCTGKLTAPVQDAINFNIYVGCSDGKLYSISQTGTIKSLVVGDGVTAKVFGGIVDPPLVDGINGFIYAVSGSANNGANGVLVQAKADFSSSVAVPIGSGNQCNIHVPTPNNAYLTSPTAAGALMYVAGTTGTVGPCTSTGATGGTGDIFAATFGAGGVMTAGAPTHKTSSLATPGNEFAPMIEFFNPHIGGGDDLLFFAVLCTGADMASYNITAGFPTTTGFFATPIAEGFGTSGIVVDNSAVTTAGNFPQAASFYFNALGENATCTGNTGANTTPGTLGCAVKLTQAALQ